MFPAKSIGLIEPLPLGTVVVYNTVILSRGRLYMTYTLSMVQKKIIHRLIRPKFSNVMISKQAWDTSWGIPNFWQYLALKGQCHEIFCFWLFSWISFPPAPEYPIRTVSNFFENSQRYSQVKVHHRRQICHRCQRHRRQILPPVLLVLLIPAANLPPVSTTPVAICHRYQRHRRQICHRCQWHRWQIMETISGCWDLKVSLKAKMFL